MHGAMIPPIEGLSDRSLFFAASRRQRALRRLASGRLDRAADDAARLAIAQRLAARVATLDQGSRNLTEGIGLVATAEGALASVSDALGRMRELAVRAANGTLSDPDRAALQAEYDQLTAEIDRVAASTEFQGRTLLDGSLDGAGALMVEPGAGEAVRVAVPDRTAAALGVDSITLGDGAALEALDRAIDDVADTRGDLGAVRQILDRAVAGLRDRSVDAQEARARLQDTDVAAEVAARVRDGLLAQAVIATRVHADRLAPAALRLLS